MVFWLLVMDMMMLVEKIFILLKILGIKLGEIKDMSNLLKLMLRDQDFVEFLQRHLILQLEFNKNKINIKIIL
jgi:hypothetical protein